jgi:hypothetical protein
MKLRFLHNSFIATAANKVWAIYGQEYGELRRSSFSVEDNSITPPTDLFWRLVYINFNPDIIFIL